MSGLRKSLLEGIVVLVGFVFWVTPPIVVSMLTPPGRPHGPDYDVIAFIVSGVLVLLLYLPLADTFLNFRKKENKKKDKAINQ